MSEAVILIHGLGRTHRSLRKIEKNLINQGYKTYNKSYPSTKKTINQSAQSYIDQALTELNQKNYSKIHFVTHSLGGLLVRYYLSNQKIKNLGRIVMLAPPNHGSAIAEKYHDKWWYKFATGPSGQQLTHNNPVFQQLRPLTAEVAIIIGNKSSDPWFNHAFNGEHDGKVSVESAKLKEEHSLKVVNNGHTLLMESNKVIADILSFIKNGYFSK